MKMKNGVEVMVLVFWDLCLLPMVVGPSPILFLATHPSFFHAALFFYIFIDIVFYKGSVSSS
jgi:hypothetical protein